MSEPLLTIERAVEVALVRSRHLIAARLQVDEAVLRRTVAALNDNPSVSYGLDNVILGEGNDQEQGLRPGAFDQPVHSVEVSQKFDIWFKKSARVSTARAHLAAVQARVQNVLRELTRAVRQTFVAAFYAQQEQGLLARSCVHYDSLQAASHRLVVEGRMPSHEARIADAEAVTCQANRVAKTRELAQLRARLAELLAYAREQAIPAVLAMPNITLRPLPDANDAIKGALQRRSDLLAAQADVVRSELALAAAYTEPFPDLTVGLGYTRSFFEVSGDNAHTLNIEASFPIPLFERNQGGIGLALIEQRRMDNALVERNLQVQQEVNAALQNLASSRSLARALDQAFSSSDDDALVAAQSRFERGGVRLVEAIEYVRSHWRLQTAYLTALRDWKQAEVALAYATEDDLQP